MRTLLAACALALASCGALSSSVGGGPPVLVTAVVGSPGAVGIPPGHVATDTDVLVAHASSDVAVFVQDKATGITVFWVRLIAGKRLVYSRTRGYSELFELDAPIPSWARVVFAPETIGQLQLTFLDEEVSL